MKRIISLLLSITFVLSAMPLAFAAGDEDLGENLALGKNVYCDNVYMQDEANFGPAFATDGNVNTRSITHNASTSEDKRNGFENYLLVDLGDVFELTNVIVHTRRDSDADWARKDFAVYIGNNESLTGFVEIGRKDTAGDFGSALEVSVPNTRARYILVVNCVNITRGFGVSEIEAYGNEIFEGVTPVYPDMTGAATDAATLLGKLGVMSGISTKEFGAKLLITRAEAAKLICDFAKIGASKNYSGQFADVSADNEYAGYIQSGLDAGFISKADNFRPDDYVMGYEFIKMVLCINGHYIKTTNGIVYPSNIMDVALELDLLDGATTDGYDFLNRENAAVIMYNALLAKTFGFTGTIYEEGDETLLQNRYDATLMRGTLTSNGISRLDKNLGGKSTKSVIIDGVVYENDSKSAQNLLGHTVYYLLNKDGVIIEMWSDSEETKIVSVDTSKIKSADFNQIVVYEGTGNKTKKYNMVSNPYKLLNDVAYGGITKEDLLCENGELILIDNNDDGDFDVINIKKPIIGLINSLSLDEETNTLKVSLSPAEKGVSGPYNYKYNVVEVTNDKGIQSKIANLGVGTFVYIYADKDGKVVKIQRMPLPSAGVIDGDKEDYISISGKTYEKTAFFKRQCKTVEFGKNVEFYTDLQGRIVYMEETTELKTSEVMAIGVKMIVNPDDDYNYFKVYTENGEFKELQFAEKVNIDGAIKHYGELKAQSYKDKFLGKLLIISVNAKNQVYSITTEGLGLNPDISLLQTNRGATGFYNGETVKLAVDEEIPVFTIPVLDLESGIPNSATEYEKYFSVVDISSKYAVGSENRYTSPKVYGYDADTNTAKALMLPKVYTVKSSNFGVISNNKVDALVFDSCVVCVNQDGDTYYEITGYDLSKGVEKTIQLKPGITRAPDTYKIQSDSTVLSSVRGDNDSRNFLDASKLVGLDDSYFKDIIDFECGDIIRYDRDSEGNYSILELVGKNTFKTDGFAYGVKYTQGERANSLGANFRLLYATVSKIEDGKITFVGGEAGDIVKTELFQGNMFVVENGGITVQKAAAAGATLDKDDNVIVFSSGGNYRSVVAYR